jgi:hypothetical protein
MQVGQSITVTAGGFNAGESVGVTLHSTPQTLTPATASSTGAVTYNFTVPSGLANGSHSVVFVGNTSAVTQTFAFTLGSASATPTPSVLGEVAGGGAPTSLPFTGANIGRPMLFAVAALWSGFVLLLLSRRGALVIVGGASTAAGGSHRRNTLAAAHSTITAASRGRHRSTGSGNRVR